MVELDREETVCVFFNKNESQSHQSEQTREGKNERSHVIGNSLEKCWSGEGNTFQKVCV